MLSKEEAKTARVTFWENFMERMRKHRSVGGYRVNWLKYNTRAKSVLIRAFADERTCLISLDFEHKNASIRELQIEQMDELKTVFASNFESPFKENPKYIRENGLELHRIYFELENVSIFNEADYPKMYDFMEKHLRGMDAFWNEFGELFEQLK